MAAIQAFPDNIKIEANIVLTDPASTHGSGEANVGWRIVQGFDSLGYTGEIFKFSDTSVSEARVRRAANWANIGTSTITPTFTAGQLVKVEQVINKAGNSATLIVTDVNLSTVLANISADTSGFAIANPLEMLMVGNFNMNEARFRDIKVTANGGAGAILLEDTFDGGFDTTKWYAPNPATTSFATLQNGMVRLNGDDPNNGSGDFAWLPTSQQFGDFDLSAKFILTDLNSGAAAREGGDWLSVRFRESNVNSALYEVAVWPNAGEADLDGTGVASPAIALRRGIAQGDYEYISGPFALPAEYNPGDTVYVFVKANGDRLEAFVGPDASTAATPSVYGNDANLTSGIVQFSSFGIVGIDLDEFSISEAGTGNLPETPIESSVNSWDKY
jgi:hypothetical protein